MLKKFVIAAAAAMSLDATAGSVLLKLSELQPVLYENEHIELNVDAAIPDFAKEEGQLFLMNVGSDDENGMIAILTIEPDSPAVRAYFDFVDKWGDPKPGNCYVFESKKGMPHLSNMAEETRFDHLKWVQCPYTQHNAGSVINGVVTDFSADGKGYMLSLGGTMSSRYDKDDKGINNFIRKHGAIKKGMCLELVAPGEGAVYLAGSHANTTGVELVDCSTVSRPPEPAKPHRQVDAKKYKRLGRTDEKNGWFILIFQDNSYLALKPDDKGLMMFKKDNSRRPYHRDCIGYTEITPAGHHPKRDGNMTSVMISAHGSECDS